jgi:copper(I)-binding protein
VVALATGLVLAAAGCSAGQITQTDTQVAAVNGASGQVGSIFVRDAQLAFPVGATYYKAGDVAPIIVTIINDGDTPDKLLAVTGAGPAEISGDVDLEPHTTISSVTDLNLSHTSSSVTPTSTPSGSPSSTSASSSSSSVSSTSTPSGSASSSGSPSSTGNPSSSVSGSASASSSASAAPVEPGKVHIKLKLASELRPGQTVKVTFLFEKAGPLTLDLPIGADPNPRAESTSGH